jgi:hypothetical protein
LPDIRSTPLRRFHKSQKISFSCITMYQLVVPGGIYTLADGGRTWRSRCCAFRL